MGKTQNPFEHRHPHRDDDEPTAPLDPAQESLADALRVSFFVLKIVMVVLLVWYLFSNVFNVQETQVAVRLRFGHIVGGGQLNEGVLLPGGYWSFPYPIDQIIRVPTEIQTVNLDDSFWFDLTEDQKALTTSQLAAQKTNALNPEKDGYLLTGDANVVHAKWKISFQVGGKKSGPAFTTHVKNYVTNVGDMESAEALVRLVSERQIVTFAAGQSSERLIKSLTDTQRVELKAAIQKSLDELESGLRVTTVTMETSRVPNPVWQAFNAVTEAENAAGQAIQKAHGEAQKMLIATAGPAHTALWRLIQEYEIAHESADSEAIAAMQARLDEVLATTTIDDGTRPVRIEGQVQTIIAQAKAYRDQYVTQVGAEAELFESLLDQYRQSPQVVRRRLIEQMRQKIMTGKRIELIGVSPGKVVVETNTDAGRRAKWLEEDREEKKN